MGFTWDHQRYLEEKRNRKREMSQKEHYIENPTSFGATDNTMRYVTVRESNEFEALAFFEKRNNIETIVAEFNVTLKSSCLEIADVISNFFKERGLKPLIKGTDGDTIYVMVDADALVEIYFPSHHYKGASKNPFKKQLGKYVITMYSNRDIIEGLSTFLNERFINEKHAAISWWFAGSSGPNSHKIYLEKNKTILQPEYYPTLDDPHKAIEKFLASNESILLLEGPPGTGKTTLLRHMIVDSDLEAAVIYDQNLMKSDKFFQNFMFGEDDLLVIEDADDVLSSRDLDKNILMSRFLNISDGLIKMPEKKIVFTTNLTDFSKVDHAILRPGRCHGVWHFRPLTYDETVAAATKAGVPVPTVVKDYTLAEIFNQQTTTPLRKFGFISAAT